MKNLNKDNRFPVPATLTALVAACLLIACGGGGGGGPTAAEPAKPVSAAATLVTSVPAASYTGNADIAFLTINEERSKCGFGLLAQNTQLDAAAAAHDAYSVLSWIPGDPPHEEIPGRAGFTGATQTDRALAKGYDGRVTEVLGTGPTARASVTALISAPYHLRALFNSYRDVGLAARASGPSAMFPSVSINVNPGTKKGDSSQLLASGDVVTYPCNGVTGVNFQLRGEDPNPVPGRDLAANPIGTPVLIKVRDGNTLRITSSSMINVGTGAAVVLRPPVGLSNDPNNRYSDSEAYVAPDGPLAKGSAYQVTINGTNNGVAFSRTFSFTTGTGVN